MPDHLASAKPYKGMGMEGWVAQWYSRTRRNDMEDFRREARAVAEHLRSDCNVLEVAPGPGFFAIELAKLGDFSKQNGISEQAQKPERRFHFPGE